MTKNGSFAGGHNANLVGSSAEGEALGGMPRRQGSIKGVDELTDRPATDALSRDEKLPEDCSQYPGGRIWKRK